MENLQYKSYLLEKPSYYYGLNDVLKTCALQPRVTFQIEKLEDDCFRLWRVTLLSGRCPSCGHYRGTTDPGMPDPKKQGGAEHICWKCAEMFKEPIRLNKILVLAGEI